MKRLLLTLALLLVTVSAEARGKLQGWVERGGSKVTINNGLQSTQTFQRSYPGATVTVKLAGTSTNATIYSDAAGTAKSNPFSADSSGFWFFWADDGDYDVTFSGSVAYTLSSLRVISGSSFLSVRDYGARGDGVTDDTVAIQAAIDASADWSNVALTGLPASFQSVGGGAVWFPQTTTGYVVSANLKINNAKIRLMGPAKLILSAGVTGFDFNGTTPGDHTGVVIENLDFVGGAIGIDTATSAVNMPISVYNCMFVNQTTAGIKIGTSNIAPVVRDSTFTGINGYGIWLAGGSSDDILIDHNIFIYNYNYDLYIQSTNVFRVTNNDFVSNFRTPASSAANIYVDVGASSDVGGYSIISGNKFGPEGRTAGNAIVYSGTGVMTGVVITNNTLHYSPTTGQYAIKVAGGLQMRGVKISNNTLTYCTLLDTSAQTNGTNQGDTVIDENVSIAGGQWSQITRGNYRVIEHIEPPADKKYNVLRWSRWVNSGADFTYTNATPSYMTAVDEQGIANNATTVNATAVANTITYNSVETNNVQKFYSMSLWMKLNASGIVRVALRRGSDYAVYNEYTISTSWTRLTFDFYQTYFAAGNPLLLDLTIPNGATITLGGITVVPGRDVGDLRSENGVREVFGLGTFGPNAPAGGVYWPAGTRVFNSVPGVGNPKGWICTVAGNPPTCTSEGNL